MIMGKILEIIGSGQAPGFPQKGRLDPRGVQAKALKGLREIENEPIYKHGPVRGAKRISDYFGLGTASDIRRTWEKPFGKRKQRPSGMPGIVATLALGACLLLLGVRTAKAGYIVSGENYYNGQQIYAQDLLNGIQNAIIGPGFYAQQPVNPALLSSDTLLEYSSANHILMQVPLQTIYTNSLPFTLAPPGTPNVYTNDLFLFYSQSAAQAESIQFTNLEGVIASNLPVQNLNFAPSNNAGATNVFALSPFPSQFTPTFTNNQAQFLVWGTNGQPYQEPFSNVLSGAQTTIETNSLGWTFLEMFFPWKIYGTNTESPYTNVFGYTTNFPITAFIEANNTASTNYQTLTDTDTVPVNANQQSVVGAFTPTNTAMTLLALYQYMTNKNALPPYTIGRAQFSGIPFEGCITNCNNNSGIITNLLLTAYNGAPITAAINWSNPVPVSFTGGQPGNSATVPTIASNTVYWVQVTNEPLLSFQIFTNLSTALARTNPITGNGVAGGASGNYLQLLWLTNYTTVNLAPIQLCDVSTPESGWYGCSFLSPSATPYYYLSGSVEPVSGNAWGICLGLLNYTTYQLYSTNAFWMQTAVSSTWEAPPFIEVLVQPE